MHEILAEWITKYAELEKMKGTKSMHIQDVRSVVEYK